MFLFQLFCFELRRASYYCTRSSRARVERVSSASRARASVNLWVDGTVATVWKLAPHSSAAHFKMNKFNIPHAAGAEARA